MQNWRAVPKKAESSILDTLNGFTYYKLNTVILINGGRGTESCRLWLHNWIGNRVEANESDFIVEIVDHIGHSWYGLQISHKSKWMRSQQQSACAITWGASSEHRSNDSLPSFHLFFPLFSSVLFWLEFAYHHVCTTILEMIILIECPIWIF